MTIVRDGKGKGVEECERAFMGVVLGPVGTMLACCVGAVVGCEIVAANEARTRVKRATEHETMMADIIRAKVRGVSVDEEAMIGMAQMSQTQSTRKMSDVQVSGNGLVLGNEGGN